MYKQYVFPMQIFIILEKANCRLWTNRALEQNNYYLFFAKSWFLPFIEILKKELFLNATIFIDHSGIDMLQLNSSQQTKWFFFFSRFQLYYNFYSLTLKTRFLLFLTDTKEKKISIPSIDRYFNNANWLEREASEMYGLFFFYKQDGRKLLLDYSKIENPMLKDFPSEGLTDVFYNFFFNQVITNKNEIVEL